MGRGLSYRMRPSTNNTLKSKNKVPDLSRYSQYNTPTMSDRDSIISAGAAASALRTHSLTRNSYNPHQFNQRQSYRANSLSALSGNPYRSNSLTSNSSRLSQQPEKIIVRTTKTKDQYGRTTSITTETIRRLGSYELVKTETKDVLPTPPPSALFAEQELGSILEEDESETPRKPRAQARLVEPHNESPPPPSATASRASSSQLARAKSPVRSILKNGSGSAREKHVTVLGDDEEMSDGGSVYSDALETLPLRQRTVRKKTSNGTLDNVKVSEDIGSASKVERVSPSLPQQWQPQPQPQKQKQLDEEEMYKLAYQVALKKVYGDKPDAAPPEPKKGGFRTYSLRGEPPSSKKKPSPKLGSYSSRTNSLTSLSRPFEHFSSSVPSTPVQNPNHSPELEPTPRYSMDRSSMDRLNGLGLQVPPPMQTEGSEETFVQPEAEAQSVQPMQPVQPVKEKKVRRKTSLSAFFQHPAMRYNNAPVEMQAEPVVAQQPVEAVQPVQPVEPVQPTEPVEPVFRRHSMRDRKKTKPQNDKNYNYQLNNAFTPEGPAGDAITHEHEDSDSVVVHTKPKPKKKKFKFSDLFKKKREVVV